ncbi:MAG TPA: carboxypeptidase regulatory-like domain-containing protein [Longimicrobiales bacterium]|nr:carboxypeptidase regulatory-like domain-containing protein [Longimicrobiales bacterium]
MMRCRMRDVGAGILLAISTSAIVATAAHARQDVTQAQAAVGVRGRVVEQGGGRPLAGVFVALIDAQGERQAGVLSNPDGWYYVRAPGPGRYTLHYELIGYASRSGPAFTAAAGTTVVDEVQLVHEPIVLESLDVATENTRCHLTRETGAQTYRVWEEARKVLTVAAWLEQDAGMAYQVVQHEYSRDLFSRELLQDVPARLHVTSGVGRSPFISAPADELVTSGFVRTVPGGGYMYYGIDAATLLSAAFLENYCFRLVLPARNSDMVGLAFQPVATRSNVDITGMLWLDSESMELKFLEYEYTRHPQLNAPPELFGGRVEFQRLPNNAWIVSDWWIRMPEAGPRQRPPASTLGARATRVQVLRASGLTIREAGGSVRYTGLGAGQVAEPAGATIRGSVYDSTRLQPLANATVFVEGTVATARTDADGRFVLRDLPAGDHRVAFLHPYTDSLALPVRTVPVRTTAGAESAVTLHVPSGASCEAADAGPVVQLAGFVIDRHGEPAAAHAVTAVWHEPAPGYTVGDQRRGVRREVRQQVRTLTDEDGRYVVCGLPPSTEVTLQPGRGRNIVVETARGGVQQQHLVVR